MNILYLSVLASETTLSDALVHNPKFSSFAVHKFNRLVAEGLAKNGHKVVALSTFILPSHKGISSKNKIIENGVEYHYIKAPRNSQLRRIWITIYCFFRVFLWGAFNKKEKVLIADVLTFSACVGAICAARLTGLRRVGIMTDLPSVILKSISKTKGGLSNIEKICAHLNRSFLYNFSHYVFLTEQMNDLVNVKKRPYIVLEGLVDADIAEGVQKEKYEKKVVVYAGGLYKEYGIEVLIDGFIKADIKDSALWFFGSGPFVEKLKEYCKNDERIVYMGVCSNKDVVEAEKKASLLVNPRPSNEEFTKYSFPSKNMEYMVSGTPVLTTKLPGMPEEYNDYVYLFGEGEDVLGYSKSLQYVLTQPIEELKNKGEKARQWVLTRKNNIVQSQRIITLIGAE